MKPVNRSWFWQLAVSATVILIPSRGSDACQVEGVPRTENAQPKLARHDRWTIGEVPIFEVGNPGETEGPDFYRVRGLVRLSNGVTVVANTGNFNLVYLGPSGSVITTVGRMGNGPGEFRAMRTIGRAEGDSVFVVDVLHQTISIFDDLGNFGRQMRYGTVVPHGYLPQGILPDGRFLFASDALTIGGKAEGPDSTLVLLVRLPGAVSDTVAQLPKSFLGSPPGSLAFGPPSVFAVGEEQFYWGHGDRFEFRQFDQSGTLVRVFSKEWEPFHVSERIWQRVGEARIESLRRGRTRDMENLIRRARQDQARIQRAEYLPAFLKALVDTEGNLWVMEYSLTGVRTAPWHVFDPSGRWITEVETPEGFTMMAVGADWVMGVALEEGTDAEVVQLLPLYK